MSSAGLRMLLLAYRTVTGKGGKIVLVGLSERSQGHHVGDRLPGLLHLLSTRWMPAWRRWLSSQDGRSRHGSRRRLPNSRVPGLQVPARQARSRSARRSVPGGVNFSIYSSHATPCTLVLFEQGRAAAEGRDPLPGRVPHRQRLVDDRLRPGLREHRVRLPHGRPVQPAGRAPLRPLQDPARPVRPGHRRPRRLGRCRPTGTRRLPAPRRGWSSTTSTGTTTTRWRSRWRTW